MKKSNFIKTFLLLCLMMAVGNMWAQDPVKCTSTEDLVAGDVYYISSSDTYSSEASVMGKSTGENNFPETTFGAAPCELTLGGSATSGWTFSYVDGSTTYYLDPTSTTSSNYLKRSTSVTDYGKFTIKFTEGVAEITSKGKNDRNLLQYNKDSKCYSCYRYNQGSVYLYKKGSGTSTPDYPTDASWSISPESVSMKKDKSTTTTITTNYDGTLSVSSNNSDIATATINGKVITVVGVAEGTTTISITGAETSKYNAINKTINVTVIPLLAENEIFYESFDKCSGTGGNDNLWSGSIASKKENHKTDNTWHSYNGYGAKGCAKYGQGSELGYAITPALGHVCDAILTFKAAAWDGTNESTTLKLSVIDGGSISQPTVELTKGAWQTYNITLTGLTANSKIKFEGEKASNSRFFLDEVSVVKTEATVSLNAACHDTDGIVYSTYSNASAFIVPQDITVYEVEAHGTSLTLHAYVTGAIVPRNTGVLVASKTTNTGGDYKVKLTDEEGDSPLGNSNALRPSGNNGIAKNGMTEDGAKKYYRLTMHNKTDFGFWWGAEEGGPFDLAANKAYLVVEMPSSSSAANAAPAMGIVFNTSDATNIVDFDSGIDYSSKKRSCYNLNGQRILSPQNDGRGYKGIVIVNGKKFINK